MTLLPIRPARSVPLILALALAATPAARAGEAAATMQKAEELAAQGDAQAALATAREALGQLWQTLPLGFSRAVLVVPDDRAGYGIYTPRETNAYKPGEPIEIHVEPFGYGFGRTADGRYEIAFDVDLDVQDAAGNSLGKVANVMSLKLTSRGPNTEFYARLTYDLKGAPKGDYVLVTTMRDRNSDKAGSFRTRIRITE